MPHAADADLEPLWRRRLVLALGLSIGVPTVLVLVAVLTGWGVPFDGTLEGPRLPIDGREAPASFAVEALELPAHDTPGPVGPTPPPSASRHPLVLFTCALTALALAAAIVDRRSKAHRVETLAWVSGSLSLMAGTWLSVSTARYAELYLSLEEVYLRAPEHAVIFMRVAPWLIALGAIAVARVLWTRRDGLGMALAGLVLPLHGVVLMDLMHFAHGHLDAPAGTQEVRLPTLSDGVFDRPGSFEVARLQVAGTGPAARLWIDFAPARFDFDEAAYSGSVEGDWREPLRATLARYGTSPTSDEPWLQVPAEFDSGHTVLLAVDRDLRFGRLVPLLRALEAEGAGSVLIAGDGLGTPGTRNKVSAYLGTRPDALADEPLVPVHLALEDGEVRLRAGDTTYDSLVRLAAGEPLFEHDERRFRSGRRSGSNGIRQREFPRDVALHVADDVPWQHVAQLASELMTVVLVTAESGDKQR